MSLSRIVGIVTTILGGVGIYALLSQSTEALSFRMQRFLRIKDLTRIRSKPKSEPVLRQYAPQ